MRQASAGQRPLVPVGCTALGLFLILLIAHREARADIYRWVDRSGQIHFTDNLSQVPPEYLSGVERRPGTTSSEGPPPSPETSSRTKGNRAKDPSRSPPAGGLSAKVVAVLDGDTIVISGGEKVRYAGLNTPEIHHPDRLPEYCGQEAFEVNRRLVAGKTVRLEFDARRRDRYGRLLAYVYADHLFVNAELIRLGYGQVSMYKENQRYYKEFNRLQEHAIAARRGLWGGCVDVSVAPKPAKPKPVKQKRGTTPKAR